MLPASGSGRREVDGPTRHRFVLLRNCASCLPRNVMLIPARRSFHPPVVSWQVFKNKIACFFILFWVKILEISVPYESLGEQYWNVQASFWFDPASFDELSRSYLMRIHGASSLGFENVGGSLSKVKSQCEARKWTVTRLLEKNTGVHWELQFRCVELFVLWGLESTLEDCIYPPHACIGIGSKFWTTGFGKLWQLTVLCIHNYDYLPPENSSVWKCRSQGW